MQKAYVSLCRTYKPSFKTNFLQGDKYPGDKRLIHGITAWNCPAKYPSLEYKFDVKESDGNMFHPVFQKNVQSQNQSSRQVGYCRTKMS